MQSSEFLELLYYHIIYSMDTGLISVILIVATIELIRIRKLMEERTCEKNKTNKRKADLKHVLKTDNKNER